MKSLFYQTIKIWKKLNHRLFLKILTIFSTILPTFGFITLTITSQIQLQQLESVPMQLENTIANSLGGLKSPYYQVFIISLDWKYLFTDATAKKSTPAFSNLLMKILQYKTTKQFQLTDDEQAAYFSGLGWWNLIKTTIIENLTKGHQFGLGYFWNNLNDGISVSQLLKTPTQQSNKIDDVLYAILENYKNLGAYNSVNAVKTVGKSTGAPTTPDNFIVSTPALTWLKIAVVLLIILSPIFIGWICLYWFIIKGKSWWLQFQNWWNIRFKKTENLKPETENSTN